MTSQTKTGDAISSALAHTNQIDTIVVGHGGLAQIPTLLREYFNSANVFLVADENTMGAAGERLKGILAQAGISSTAHVFPGTPRLKPSVENAECYLAELEASGATPVAVGSGVINDLVKYTAFRLGKPYLTVATAASMDGYASMGAPLIQKGFKHTIPCAPARVIVTDIDVLAEAPPEMNAWGYGDLAGKIPAGADWLIADALGIEPLDDKAWPLISENLRAWLSHPAGVTSGDPTTMTDLFNGLATAGVAMALHQSSRPASGADHQMAHMWEMDGLTHAGEPVSHGTCVALGTLTILALYDWLLGQELGDIDVDAAIGQRKSLSMLESEIKRRFPSPAMAERVLVETRHKYVDDETLHARLQLVRSIWPDLRDHLRDYLIPEGEMRQMLAAAGVGTDPAAVGIDNGYHRQTLMGARLIRRRYTVLDLLEDTGLLDDAVAHVFSGAQG